jgi:integral membrane sensor domain MASE1
MMAAPRSRTYRALTLMALTAVYITVAKLGLRLNGVGSFATLVWPSTGIAFAALLLFGEQLWPAITLGALTVNLWLGAPPLVGAGIAVGNTLEAVIAVRLLRRYEFAPAMARISDVVTYVIWAAIFATTISPTVGVLSLYAGGLVGTDRIADTWFAWWLGDAIGALVVAPPLLAWGSAPLRSSRPPRIAELIVLCCALLAACVDVFGTAAAASSPLREPFILVAITIWAALRFGQRGTTTTTLVMTAFAVAATALGFGPFAGHPLSDGLALLQVFAASVAVTGLVLCAAICERQARADELARVNGELSSALGARDTFLSVASHELKTPLSALRLQAEVLLRLQPDLPPAMKEHLQRINRQVDRLNKLVVELLEVSRITAGGAGGAPRPAAPAARK